MASSGGFGRRPKSLVCHICGKEFGTASLKIHVPRCAKLWEDREALKPRRERRPVPQAPKNISQAGSSWKEIEEQNIAAAAAFEEQAMKECPNCHRTFLEDRLTIHLRSCRPDRVLNPLPAASKRAPKNEETKKQLSSTVAAKNSPKQSIKFKKTTNPASLTNAATAREEIKATPREEVKAAPVRSQAPAEEAKIGQTSGQTIPEEYEEEQVELVPCSSCGRKFKPDRIEKHSKACKGPAKPKRPVVPAAPAVPKAKKEMPDWKKQHLDFVNNIRYAKKVQEVEEKGGDIKSVEAPKQLIDPNANYIQCRHCGRRYAPQVAERHIPRCATIINKPAPPPGKRPAKQPVKKQGAGRTGSTGTTGKIKCNNCGREMPELLLASHLQNCRQAGATSRSVATLPSGTMNSPYKLSPIVNSGKWNLRNIASKTLERQNTRKNTLTRTLERQNTNRKSTLTRKTSNIRKKPVSKPSSTHANRKCPECKHDLIESARFCAFCGTKLVNS